MPVRNSEITVRDIGGETMLYGSDEGAIHVLNPTAKLIWDLCDGTHSPVDMDRVIRSTFTVPENYDVVSDVRHVIEVFLHKGLVRSVS